MEENLIIDGGVTNITDANGGTDNYTIFPFLSADVTINDTDGANIVLPVGLEVTAASFSNTGVEFTVNGFTVTILAGTNAQADLFSFIFGGDPLTPGLGTTLNFEETAGAFGADSPDTLVGADTSPAINTGVVKDDGTIGQIVISDGDLDAVGGSLSNPTEATIAGQTAELVDDVNQQNFVKLEGFGSDDSIRFTGTLDGASVTEDDVVIDPGDDTLLTVNNGGLVSQITLLGVSTGLEVQSVAEFNALGLGEILVG